ncbi:hypothetical protein EW146_g7664 [Bondarzewia mesenterica]|uniref:Uncharacterized protein n=1 Tax=Bondarzewia mesenterica TaxID=1095465 RepID=A0A4S4LKS4_9AGAM|nr:hypothetical protein EW146_g7664 [Bondarzewia mesenterica]
MLAGYTYAIQIRPPVASPDALCVAPSVPRARPGGPPAPTVRSVPQGHADDSAPAGAACPKLPPLAFADAPHAALDISPSAPRRPRRPDSAERAPRRESVTRTVPSAFDSKRSDLRMYLTSKSGCRSILAAVMQLYERLRLHHELGLLAAELRGFSGFLALHSESWSIISTSLFEALLSRLPLAHILPIG